VLGHPDVIDTAKLAANGLTVQLFGIMGVGGPPAQGLKSYIAGSGDKLICQAKATADYTCALPDGTDVAMVALVNGAAQTRPDAPAAYHDQEAAAQTARRGIWANLPPPPIPVRHPVVHTTGLLEADRSSFALDGVDGIAGPYAAQLQNYILTAGDSLDCQEQGVSQSYTCVAPDGTDVAKVVLVNGAAKAAPDAPDAYLLQQRDAIINRRGIWATMTEAQLQPYLTAVPADPVYLAEIGPDADGISYVGGQPTALIDGEVVFLALAGAAGWGYYDHYHHWHGAPDRFARHMERFHPEGRGLRGYGPGGLREAHLGGHGEFGHAGELRRPGEIGRPGEFGHAGELRRPGEIGRPGEFGRPGEARAEAGRGEFGHPGEARAEAGRGEFGHPGAGRPEMGRPEMGRAEAAHPGLRPEMARPAAAPVNRFAAAQQVARPAAPASFVRPTMPSPMARPAMPAAMARPAMPVAMARPAMPAPHPAAPAPAARHK
jgi:endonuclease YncB( thermonuclease family)